MSIDANAEMEATLDAVVSSAKTYLAAGDVAAVARVRRGLTSVANKRFDDATILAKLKSE